MSDGALERIAAEANLPRHTLEEALAWLVTLWSGEISAAEAQALTQWRAAHPDHERAWQRVQSVNERLDGVASPAAGDGLRASRRALSRRKALASLGIFVLGATGALHAWRHPHLLLTPFADLRTATGEIRRLTLPDGSRLAVNTASAVNIRFSAEARLLQLIDGEMLVATARDAANRPFRVITADGVVAPLGTRFTVRRTAPRTEVAVLQGAVRLRSTAGEGTDLPAGRRAAFTSQRVEDVRPAADGVASWAEGRLVAEQQPLAEFLAELARYRTGFIRWDPQVAGLRVSGTFPLPNTDRILRSLEQALPVRVRMRTRYWVVIEPA